MRKNDDINMKESYAWLQSENYSSHIEGYLFFMQEQQRKEDKKTMQKDETLMESVGYVHQDLFHIICSCLKLSDMLYLH